MPEQTKSLPLDEISKNVRFIRCAGTTAHNTMER